jgi:RNA exonuclease 1
VAQKWEVAITRGRQHERYDGSYDFKKYKEIDESNGIKTDWIKAKPYGSWCKNNPQAIAIDCEMCETQDPLSGAKNHKALCRISVVNAENPEEVLLDTLVKPTWPVTDYRTRINGVTKEHLDSVEFTLRHAQAFMMALCSEETVIVGHAVHNDLVALNMEHEVVADSAFLYEASDSTSASCSLKDIVKKVLNKEMPKTHDSVNDARKALECVAHWIEKGGGVESIERTPKHHSHTNSDKLFVHRISKTVKREHMISMFLNQTTIQPVDVDEIAFQGNTGKTHVSFKTAAHADLAFDSIEGKADEDLSGRLQKKVYLRNGDYIRIRKMTRTVTRPSMTGNTAVKEEGRTRNDHESPMETKTEPSYAPFALTFRDMEFSKPSGWK